MSDIGAHLLIVDDDERIRGLLQKFLIRNGFMASAARDAAHARRLLAGLDFDLIVVDAGRRRTEPDAGFAQNDEDADHAADGEGRGRRSHHRAGSGRG
jgi:ActR/RegA family two-component response regulator